jgi:hypothetical protein
VLERFYIRYWGVLASLRKQITHRGVPLIPFLMRSPHKLTICRFLFCAFWIVLLAGCGSSTASIPWKVPTQYVVQDSPKSASRDLPELLAPYGFNNTASASDDPDGVFRFTLTGIVSMNDLLEVQRLLRSWSAKNNTPLELNRAVMVFASVEGSAGSQISLFGTATLNAKVLVDIGVDRLWAPINNDGKWSFQLPSEALPQVQARGGWVYILVVKNSARQYFKKNVLSGPQQLIDAADLPPNSLLRQQQGD